MPRIQSEAAEELGQIVQYLEHLLRCAKRVAISPSFQQSWSVWRAAEGKDVTTVQQQTADLLASLFNAGGSEEN